MKCNFDLHNDPFHCAKFRKSSCSRSRVMTMHHFWTQHGPFAPNKFFWKIIIILIYLLAPFIVQNLKKTSSSGSRVMRMCNFWAQNDPFLQMRIFSENLLTSCFFHSCLSACQKLKSDINLIVKY